MLISVVGHTFAGGLVDIARFRELDGYDQTHTVRSVKQQRLRTNVTDFHIEGASCNFIIEVDYVEQIPYRDEWQDIKSTARSEVKIFCGNPSTEIYCFCKKSHSVKIVRKLEEILNLSEGYFSHLAIPPEIIRSIVSDDSRKLKAAWWSDLDPNTSKGFLKGELDESAYRTDFDENGMCSSATFESIYMQGKSVRVTGNGSVTIWGIGTTQAMVMDYFSHIIKPVLRDA